MFSVAPISLLDVKTNIDKLRALIHPSNPDALYIFERGVLRRDFLVPAVHKAICGYVQKCFLEREDGDLVMFRGGLKTTIVSEGLPTWGGAWFPNQTWLLVKNVEPLAADTMGVIMSFWEKNTVLRSLFPKVGPEGGKKRNWSAKGACLNRTITLPQPTYRGVGVGSVVVGAHFHNIICDDLIAAKQNEQSGDLYEPTRADIDAACGWLDKMEALWIDPPKSFFFHTTTRWCEDDAISHTEKWGLKHMEVDCYDEDGKPTYPSRFPEEVLEREKKRMGEFLFSALMRNKPMSALTRVFKRSYMHYMNGDMQEKAPGMSAYMGVDPAGTTSQESDYFAAVVVLVDWKGRWFVTEYINERIGNDVRQIAQRLVGKVKKWGLDAVAIETNYFRGTLKMAFEEELEREGLWTSVVEVKGTAACKKETRILWLQPLFEAGQVFLKEGMNEMETQLVNWRPQSTSVKHDDLIDALAWVKVLAQTPSIPKHKRKKLLASSWDFVKREIEQMRGKGVGERGEMERVTGVEGGEWDELPAVDGF